MYIQLQRKKNHIIGKCQSRNMHVELNVTQWKYIIQYESQYKKQQNCIKPVKQLKP